MKYTSYTINYEYGSNGERTKRIISENTASALPVDLLKFEADGSKVKPWKVFLNWITASEINSKHFEVEYSTNGTEFKVLKVIPAKGNSTQTQQYAYTHNNPILGVNYYRLQVVDQDDSRKFSPIRDVIFDTENRVTIYLYPNPADNYTNLRVEGINANDQLSINIRTVEGKQILQDKRLSASSSSLEYRINTASFANGIYVVSLTVNGKSYQFKRLVIQR